MDRYARMPNYTSNYLIELKSGKIHYNMLQFNTV